MQVASQIASGLDMLLGSDSRNATSVDQRFCVALEARAGWRTTLLVTNELSGAASEITVDYCNLPIRCRFCLSIEHLVKDCKGTK